MNLDLFYKLASIFEKHGFNLFLVGGSVRDYLLHKSFQDMDLATNATIEQMQTFLEFKTIYLEYQSGCIVFEGEEIDITTLRSESEYNDYRHPKTIKFVKTPLEEYQRRDFTINALYMNSKGNIIDYANGLKDLNQGIIRMINNPLDRFEEDPLRILRALRFAFNLKFVLDEKIKEAIALKKHLLKKINYQKLVEELYKFKAKENVVRNYLSKFKIDEVIPLYYEQKERIVFDLHCDTITRLYATKQDIVKNKLHVDFNKMQKGSYLGQVFAVFVNMKEHEDGYQYALDVIKFYHEIMKENNFFIEEALSYDDLVKINQKGKRISLLSIEEAGILQGDLSRIEQLYNLGVRMMTLTWNYPTCVGYPNIDLSQEDVNIFHYEKAKGLTEFGIQVVKKMNELGMIIDVSHLSDKGLEDVLKYSSKPICASHSSSRVLNKCARNLTKEQMIKILDNKGLIGINYCPDFVNYSDKKNYFGDLCSHFINVKEIVTSSSLAFGSDFDGFESDDDLKDCKEVSRIILELKKQFTPNELKKVGYLNFFNLIKKNQSHNDMKRK